MYRAIFRNSKNLYGKAVMPISCGSVHQESDFLKATISEMKSRFVDSEIVLADTLQHYTLEMKGYQKPKVMAKALGDEFIKRNQYIDIPIIRWDDCCKDPDFEDSLQEVKNIYNGDLSYRNAVNHDIHTFITRHLKRSPNLSKNSESLCQNYILEETAILLSFFRNQGYTYLIYPGSLPSSINIISKSYFNLPKILKIDFKKVP